MTHDKEAGSSGNSRVLNWILQKSGKKWIHDGDMGLYADLYDGEFESFDLKCKACCLKYLYTRSYPNLEGTRVTFGAVGLHECCVDVGINCLVKAAPWAAACPIDPEPDLEQPNAVRVRSALVANNFTYRVYTPPPPHMAAVIPPPPPPKLPQALGSWLPNVTLRVEAISVENIKDSQMLQGCHFSFSDAALLEMCREYVFNKMTLAILV